MTARRPLSVYQVGDFSATGVTPVLLRPLRPMPAYNGERLTPTSRDQGGAIAGPMPGSTTGIGPPVVAPDDCCCG
jgi:hypothetical protein